MKTFLPYAAAVLFLSGCSTTQRITVRSEPTGADVRASVGVNGQTPFEFEANRAANCAVTVNKQGYQPISVMIVSKDGELRPNPVLVQLAPLGSRERSAALSPETPWIPTPASVPRPVPRPIIRKTPATPVAERIYTPVGRQVHVDRNGTEYL